MSGYHLDELRYLEKDKSPKCKGLFFRYHSSSYLSSHKSIEVRKSLKLLKRKSCKGCERCEWIWEYIPQDIEDEGMEDYLGNLNNGKIYKLVPVWTPGPWEYPNDGDLVIEFKEV